jgi:hypothetical protein
MINKVHNRLNNFNLIPILIPSNIYFTNYSRNQLVGIATSHRLRGYIPDTGKDSLSFTSSLLRLEPTVSKNTLPSGLQA